MTDPTDSPPPPKKPVFVDPCLHMQRVEISTVTYDKPSLQVHCKHCGEWLTTKCEDF